MRQSRSIDDLRDKLAQQIGFLERSAELYDSGVWDEAARLATSIRILVHDARAPSLLTLLGAKMQIPYEDTALHRETIDAFRQRLLDETRRETGQNYVDCIETRPEAGLAEALWIGGGRVAWMPRLGRAPANLAQPFDDWWSLKVIEASDGRRYSRRDVVLVMANQDGGAHVDESLSADYAALLTDNLGMQTVRPEHQGRNWTLEDPPGGWISPEGNLAHATVRQVAHEVLESLRRAAEYGLL